MKLIWVTGARGFLGRHIARYFADNGWTVAGLDLEPWPAPDRAPWGIGDWCEEDLTSASFTEFARRTGLPEAVFHAAGSGAVGQSFSDPLNDFRSNVLTTALVLDFIRRESPATTFFLPSSGAVYGVRDPGPIPEDTPLLPVSPYGTHKLMAEELCRSAHRDFDLRCIVIRYFSLYGPELRKQLLWDLTARLTKAPETVELFGTGEESRDWLYVEDASRLALNLFDAAPAGLTIVNGGCGRATTVREVALTLFKHLGINPRLEFNGRTREGDPRHYQADLTRTRALGFQPQWSLDRGMAEYVDWIGKARR